MSEEGTGEPHQKAARRTHTLRHSAARHWLASEIPISLVPRWSGHASLQTTRVNLAVLRDPLGEINRVP